MYMHQDYCCLTSYIDCLCLVMSMPNRQRGSNQGESEMNIEDTEEIAVVTENPLQQASSESKNEPQIIPKQETAEPETMPDAEADSSSDSSATEESSDEDDEDEAGESSSDMYVIKGNVFGSTFHVLYISTSVLWCMPVGKINNRHMLIRDISEEMELGDFSKLLKDVQDELDEVDNGPVKTQNELLIEV